MRLQGTLKAVDFMTMPEEKFRQVLRETENDPLFRKLAYPDNPQNRVIGFRRFPNSSVRAECCDLENLPLTERPEFNVEAIVENSQEITEVIRRMGLEDFKKYFLYCEEAIDLHETAKKCGVSLDCARRVTAWVNDFFIRNHFTSCSTLSMEHSVPYLKVAAFEKSDGEWRVNYFSPVMARGRYVIRYARLEELMKSGGISTTEKDHIKILLSKLEQINARKAGIDCILQWFTETQTNFLESGRNEDLLPATQRQLAKEIGKNPSTVCRTLAWKTVVLPWGEERLLKDLFLHHKDVYKKMLIPLWEENRSYSDVLLQKLIKQHYGVSISRRTVTAYRLEMQVGSSRKRGKE